MICCRHQAVAQDWLPTEAKQGWAWLVHEWEISWENQVAAGRGVSEASRGCWSGQYVCVGPNAPAKWQGHYTVKEHCPSDETLNRGPVSLWSLKIPGWKRVGVKAWHPGQNLPLDLCPSWPPNHPLVLIGFITVSINKLMCGWRSDTIWLPSHHPSGCCTLVGVEEIPPSM